MRLDIYIEKRYLIMEDDLEGNVDHMEDNDAEVRYRCDSNIFIFININFYV